MTMTSAGRRLMGWSDQLIVKPRFKSIYTESPFAIDKCADWKSILWPKENPFEEIINKIERIGVEEMHPKSTLVAISPSDFSHVFVTKKVTLKEEIKRVIFHDPATIVYWEDGTKTVVKTQNGEKYDREKGLAMAITKKALGNEGNYYNTFTKWLKEEKEN